MQIPWKLLKEYAQGDISEIDRKELKRWCAVSEVNQQTLDEVLADKTFKNHLIVRKWDDVTEDWKTISS